MRLTSAFCGPASTAASSAPDPPRGGVCAIHQPNLFPRLSTLAKLYAADRWIVDDVQFARRDYQHRARLADLDEPARQQWLTLPTHLPQGRSTLISQARLVDPQRSRKTVQLLVRQYYGRSPHWKAVSDVLDVSWTRSTPRTAWPTSRKNRRLPCSRFLAGQGPCWPAARSRPAQVAPSAWRISRQPPAAPTIYVAPAVCATSTPPPSMPTAFPCCPSTPLWMTCSGCGPDEPAASGR